MSRVSVEVVSRLCDAPHRRTGARLLEEVVVGESPSFVMIVNSLLALPSAGRTTGPRRPRLAAGGGIVLLLTCTGATLELGALGESLHVYVYCCVD